MSPLQWIRVSVVLHQAGLPADDGAVQAAALALRDRKVPAIRDGGKWKVQADHPETRAWRERLAAAASGPP